MTVLVPLSSWMAYILGQYASAGISLDDTSGLITCEPLYAYISTIPFLFYPIIILGTFWFIVHKRVSFGIVANHEKCASTTGNLFGGKQPVIHSEKAHANTEHTSWWWDFLFPMTLFISLVIFGSLYGGGYYLLGGTRGLFDTIQNANIQAALFVGVSFTILFTILFFIARKKIKSSQLRSIILEGIKILGPTTITLLLIWTFAGLVRYDLYTGQYIATQLHTKLHLIHASLFPAIFFVSSALIAFMMGSAWGTMGVLFPIGVPMLISILNLQAPIALVQVPLLAPLLGAIISGSIVGSNSSILSDVVFMTSSSAGIYHLDLVRAMVSYITPTAISSTLAYIFVGYFILYIPQAPAVILSITLGFVINILIFYLLRRLTK
jgi:Na+/H+ antiporter NhaC